MFRFLLQITDYLRERHDDITAFRFVIYSRDGKVKKFFFLRAIEVHDKLIWLREQMEYVASEHGYDPRDIAIGLTNCLLIKGRRQYIAMLDIDAFVRSHDINKELAHVLQLLEVGDGVIVDSGRGYHFYGFRLMSKSEWKDFINEGAWDDYPEFNNWEFPYSPKLSGLDHHSKHFVMSMIQSSWNRLVIRQRYDAFLRLTGFSRWGWGKSPVEILGLFESKVVSEWPVTEAPCMEGYWTARDDYYWQLVRFDHPMPEFPKIEDSCVTPCQFDGCCVHCPSTRERLP